MPTNISMLRGINVSGQKIIKMEALKNLYASLNFKNVKTYIQSGNVIFECRETSPEILKKKIENKIKEKFGFDVVVFIRTKKELQKIIENNPFKNEDGLYVTFLTSVPSFVPTEEINKIKSSSEKFVVSGKEIYFFCPNGYGKTKLSNNFFEKKLKVSATTRNWKTVNVLSGMWK